MKCFLVIGVSGSGKSWVCEQLKDCYYIRFDKIKKSDAEIRKQLDIAFHHYVPVVFDPTIKISTLLKRNLDIVFEIYAIQETIEVVSERIAARGGVVKTENLLKRMKRIESICNKYRTVFIGTSSQVLKRLKRDISREAVEFKKFHFPAIKCQKFHFPAIKRPMSKIDFKALATTDLPNQVL